jgi:hypothetical protein
VTKDRVIRPDSEEGQKFVLGLAWAGDRWKGKEQGQAEHCAVVQTQSDFMRTYYEKKKFDRKRLFILSREISEKIPDIEEPTDEDKEWVLGRLKQPTQSWKRCLQS